MITIIKWVGMTNKQERKVAFITGASRGIGAESAVALAKAGWDVAITARTLNEGEEQNYAVGQRALPGSLTATAQAVNEVGGEALCLKADILNQASVVAAAEQAIAHYGHIDLLFNNAVYQGEGNQQNLLEVTDKQLKNIYQSNIFTPLALVKTLLPSMLSLSSSTVINMVSFTAFNDPQLARRLGICIVIKSSIWSNGGSLRAEHKIPAGFNLEPGTVITEVMRELGIDEKVLRVLNLTPQAIASVVAWLAENEPLEDWQPVRFYEVLPLLSIYCVVNSFVTLIMRFFIRNEQ